jgi:hypothetical protein
MKILARVVVTSLLSVLLLAVDAHAQARDMAFDFKTTDSGSLAMQTMNGQSTGRAVVSKGRARLDVKGTARSLAMPGAAAGDDVTILVLDSGKSLVYINPKTKQYMQVNPMEVMDRMQKMMEGMGATMQFEFTGDPKVEDVGAGPVIVGHKTQHFRITTGMTMTMSIMGETQTMTMSSVTDEYLAPDLRNMTDPFRNMSSNTMGAMGGANKAYVDRLKAVQAKLPNGMELRAETQVTINAAGQAQNMKNVREITGIENTTASDDQFAVPTGFTKVDFPLGPGGGRIPPE